MADRPARRWALGLLVLAAGIAWDFTALELSDRFAGPFPAITDVVAGLLPRIDLSRYGELFALAFIVVFLTVFVRHRRSDLPYLFTLVGVFYAGRGTFLLLLPIGAPAAGPFAAARAGPWPDPSHSFFPSGHFGLMCLLSLSLEQPWARRTLACGALVYAVGTLLTRAHYTADLLGGLVLAYAVHAWGERNLRSWPVLRAS